jgi:hypothetical protein
MKNLVICPSRGRPEQFKRFLESFKNMSRCSDLMAIVDESDKFLPYYLNTYQNCIVNNTSRNVTELINMGFNLKPDYEFYTVTNDDFVFKAEGWDTTLCRKGYISYGNDLCAGESLPTTYVVDGDIVRALGWLQLPKLSFMYGDSVWKFLGQAIHRIKYRQDVIIEHNHWCNLKAEVDETYRRTNAPEVYKADYEVFKTWLQSQKDDDVGKIKFALGLQ